jgi:hypothetical protein
VDQIEFVVAEEKLPTGSSERVEPVINGESRGDHRAGRRRSPHYAGLVPEQLLQGLLGPESWAHRHLLGCCCGVDKCSWVYGEVKFDGDVVIWRNFRASTAPDTPIAGIGPYRFDRAAYVASLRAPTPQETPVRTLGLDRDP